jgi:uroporphyrin-III C-methyltransferase
LLFQLLRNFLDKKRRVREFWVITGTTSARKLSTDVFQQQSSATVVVLMGMSKLNEIVAIFSKRGQRRNPVAIIQNGTTRKNRIGNDKFN